MAVHVSNLLPAHEDGLTAGVVHDNGALRTRLEIDDFIKKKEMANLYILALHDLQRVDTWKERFSYFQIAGIHGKPFVPWDGVRPDETTIIRKDLETVDGRPRHQPNPASGYCSHSSNLFPTWHRELPYLELSPAPQILKNSLGAYLAMLEQAIYLKMVEIAERYPEPYRRQYLEATAGFGLPYWDPTIPRRRVVNRYGYPIFKCGVPIVMMILRVMVRTPEQPNELVPLENPLYGYIFNMDRAKWDNDLQFSWEGMFGDVFQAPTMTLHTIRGLSPAGTMDHQYVNNTLTNAVSQTNGPAVPLGGKLYRILNGPPMSYTQMANSAFVPHDKEMSLNRENSLEGFHNDIHVMTGTGEGNRPGHMALNEFAAFDPIFWLHHANIDRIFAIWEALNPSDELWHWHQRLLPAASGRGGNYIIPIGTNETPETPLVPFRKRRYEDGRPIYWTSNDLRHCRTLGYTYPELVKTNSHPDELRQWVIDNYEWTTISGDPPPLETVFNTEDLEGVELFPEKLQIDGRGPLVDIPKERFIYGRSIAKSVGAIPRILGKCFKRSEHSGSQKRYRHLKGLIHDRKLTHWNATIKVKKFALNGSFQILLFLGDFSQDPSTWHHDARLVGIDAIFASHSLENCENCRQQNEEGLIDSDVIPLTTPLVAYWKSQEEVGGMKLKSLEVAEVKQFLRINLHWRVLDPQGRVHDPREIPSLSITVGSQVVRLPYEFGALPQYEEEISHYDITDRY